MRRGATDAETWHALGLVRLHLGISEGAEQAYRAGAAADPKAPECWLGLATVAITAGDAGKALEAYDQVVARRPRFAPAILGRAWALAKLGRKDEARKALDQAEAMGANADNVARQRAALTDQGGAGTKEIVWFATIAPPLGAGNDRRWNTATTHAFIAGSDRVELVKVAVVTEPVGSIT